MPEFTRRQALAASAALPAAAATGIARADGHESAGPRGANHRTFDLGGARLTTLLASTAPLDEPQGTFGMNVSPETFAEVSAENFISADSAQLTFTPVLVEQGDRRILFDTGFGQGGLTAALEEAGVAPGDITHVVITHMHPDHVGGLLADGAPAFANAEHVTGEVEHAHWTANPADFIQASVMPIADQFTLVQDGAEIAPGITAMMAAGHTPGHMVYRVDGERGSILITADLANHYVWSLGHPDWEVRFDMDKEAAAASRRRVLDMLASERMAMVGYHLPFPAAGYVETRDDGFRWVPHSYQF